MTVRGFFPSRLTFALIAREPIDAHAISTWTAEAFIDFCKDNFPWLTSTRRYSKTACVIFKSKSKGFLFCYFLHANKNISIFLCKEREWYFTGKASRFRQSSPFIFTQELWAFLLNGIAQTKLTSKCPETGSTQVNPQFCGLETCHDRKTQRSTPVPCSQSGSWYPAGHVQSHLPIPFVQLPPLAQGLLAHSSKSAVKTKTKLMMALATRNWK